jgi:nucleoside-diphosphate-sugar epimerase
MSKSIHEIQGATHNYPTTLIVGGGGQIGQLLALALQSGRRGAGLAVVRPGKRPPALVQAEVPLIEADITGPLTHLPTQVDAVVFSAGAGTQGFDQTLLVDLWGARRMYDWALAHGVSRFVMVSSIGVEDPLNGPPFLRPYLAAKRMADDALMTTPLDWTIVKPGRLLNTPARGAITTHRNEYWPTVTRGDVAETLRQALLRSDLGRCAFDVYAGSTPIASALDHVAATAAGKR